jgi:RNA polymerase sigma-70 factor (ECF subfamily)
VASGDYDRLIQPIEDKMMRTVWHLVRDADDADDAFQVAFGKIWKNRGKVGRHPNPHAAILRICINSAYDVLRRNARKRRIEAIRAIPENHADSSLRPDESLIARESHQMVLRAIGRLPRNQATAITLRCIEGLPYVVIGQALGCSEATARTHVARGRNRLCEMFPHLAQGKTREAI